MDKTSAEVAFQRFFLDNCPTRYLTKDADLCIRNDPTRYLTKDADLCIRKDGEEIEIEATWKSSSSVSVTLTWYSNQAQVTWSSKVRSVRESTACLALYRMAVEFAAQLEEKWEDVKPR
jgi:hypothetical protein